MSSRTIEVSLPYDTNNQPSTVVLGGIVVPPSVTGGNPPVGAAYVTLYDPQTGTGGTTPGAVGTTTNPNGITGLNVNLTDNPLRQIGVVGFQDDNVAWELGRIRWLMQILVNEYNPDNGLDLTQLNPTTDGI